MFIKGTLTLVALYIFKRFISFNDNNFIFKMLSYSVAVLLLFTLNHWIFMKLIFSKDDDKPQ